MLFRSGPIPPQLLDNIIYNKYEYDPQKARELLKKAGYPNGFSADLWQGNSDQVSYITEAIQAQASKVLHTSTLYLSEPMIELAEEIGAASGIPRRTSVLHNIR